MKRLVNGLGIILIISLCLTEAHSIFSNIDRNLSYTQLDLFWKKSFHFKLSLEWYMKTTFDDIFFIVLSFVAAKVCYQYSYKLYLICWIVFGYWIFDLLLFWYNYKLGYFHFYVIGAAFVMGVLSIILTKEKRTSQYKSLI